MGPFTIARLWVCVMTAAELFFIPPNRSSTKLWSIAALPLHRQGDTVSHQGPPGEWDKGWAGDARAVATVWPAGNRDDCYESWKVGWQTEFIFIFHLLLILLQTSSFSLCVFKLQEDVSNIPGANHWDVSCCWICAAHGLCIRWW